MRTAIVLAGSLLFVSSALAAEPTGGAESKPIILAAVKVYTSEAAGVDGKVARVIGAETQVLEGSLEGFGAIGLAQLPTAPEVSTRQAARSTARVAKEAQIAEGSLEKFGATGLPQ